MSRFRQALAATTMAAAAAAGAALIAAAGTVPAAAAVAAPVHVSAQAVHHDHHKGQAKKATFTFRRKVSPDTTQPCLVRPHSAQRGTVKPANCLPPEITCNLYVNTPVVNYSLDTITATTNVVCNVNVTQINDQAALLKGGALAAPGTDITNGDFVAGTFITIPCGGGTYSGEATAGTTFPPDYVLVAGSNPMHATSASLTVAPFCAPPPPPGGCAVRAPSPGAHPAGRKPDFKTC